MSHEDDLRRTMAMCGLRTTRRRDCLMQADADLPWSVGVLPLSSLLCASDPPSVSLTTALIPEALAEIDRAIERLQRARLAIEWAQEANE